MSSPLTADYLDERMSESERRLMQALNRLAIWITLAAVAGAAVSTAIAALPA